VTTPAPPLPPSNSPHCRAGHPHHVVDHNLLAYASEPKDGARRGRPDTPVAGTLLAQVESAASETPQTPGFYDSRESWSPLAPCKPILASARTGPQNAASSAEPLSPNAGTGRACAEPPGPRASCDLSARRNHSSPRDRERGKAVQRASSADHWSLRSTEPLLKRRVQSAAQGRSVRVSASGAAAATSKRSLRVASLKS
jgi:hypothetical protein